MTLNLLPGFPVIGLSFDRVTFASKNGAKTNIDVSLGAVTFRGPLKFVVELQKYLDPSSGPFVELRTTGILAGLRFSLPALTLGGFNAYNLRFFAAISIFFDGKPLRMELGVSDFADPFTMSVGVMGGRGYFFMALTADGLQEMDGSFELGAVAELNLAGVARGRGYIMAGIRFRLLQKPKSGGGTANTTEICGYVRAGGQLTIIGIISVSLEIYVQLCWQSPNRLYGSARLRVEIHLLFFSETIERSVEYTFAGSGDAADQRDRFLLDASSLPEPNFNEDTFNLASLPQHPELVRDQKRVAYEPNVDWDLYEAAFVQ